MPKVDKLLKRLNIAESDLNFYEAHQICRTVYYRWLEMHEFNKLADFLHDKTIFFQKSGESAIALDLADLYADTLNKARCDVSDKNLFQISMILSALAPEKSGDSDREDTRISFINKIVYWSCTFEGATPIRKKFGEPRIQEAVGDVLNAAGRWRIAKNHYLASINPVKLVKILQTTVEHEADDDQPADFLIGIHILQIASIGRLGFAIRILLDYTSQFKQFEEKPPYTSAALNFVWLCLLALYVRSLDCFTEAVETYRPTIHQSRQFVHLVDRLGQKFFGLPPKNNDVGGGLIGNLLKGLIGQSAEPDTLHTTITLQPGDDPFLAQFSTLTTDTFHQALAQCAQRNPPRSAADLDFVDVVEDHLMSGSQQQGEMDLD